MAVRISGEIAEVNACLKKLIIVGRILVSDTSIETSALPDSRIRPTILIDLKTKK